MKKRVNYLLKCSIAAIISIIILSLFSLVYYNPPISTVQPDWITNNKFVPNLKWSYMAEGFGYGEIDNLGYNSTYYDNCSDPDIVFLGSSHLEAIEVPGNANCVYLLNEKFDKDDLPYNDFECLNLGVSAHFFEVSASNFEYVANEFEGAKYVVIEALDIKFSPSELDDIINCKFHSPMEEKSFIHKTVQKVPYFRLMNKKINETNAVKNGENAAASDGNSGSSEDYNINIYTDKMNIILERISKISKEKGIEPIILMHGRFWVDSDRNIVTEEETAYKNAFMKCCESNGIKVIDVLPEMIAEYKENFEFSYGFSNSVPGEGHLNITGHRIIAEELYEEINEMEENK